MEWKRIQDAVVRRPLVAAVVFLILGISAHRVIAVGPGMVMGICGGLLLLSFLLRRFGVVADVLLGAALFGCGVAVAELEEFYFPREHIANFTKDERRLGRLEIEVITAPRIIGTGDLNRPLPPRQIAQGKVLRILTTDGWKTGTGTVLVQLQQPRSDLEIRQRLEVLGMLERPAPAMNPVQFDWANYYREQRILAGIEIAHASNVTVLATPGPNILDRIRARARTALEDGFSKEHQLDHALLRALVLGDSDPMLRDVQDEFIRTGTSHHLAISGMHVAVLGTLIYFICRLLMLSPRTAAIVGMGFVLLYGLVALPSAPVIRSVLFCLVFGIGLISRRSLDGVHLVALSAFAMLIYHPLDLYNAGFQLSFGTTLGLMLFAPALLKFFVSLRDRDMEIAYSIQRPQGWVAVKRYCQLKGGEIFGTCLVAAVVAAPLTALHFNQFNVWGIPATILLIIPVFLSLVAGLVKIVVSLLIPPLAPAMATLAAFPVISMRWCVDWMARWPGNDVPLPSPPTWLVLAFYVLLLAFLLPVEKRRVKKYVNGVVAATMAMIIALPLLLAPAPDSATSELRLTLLSVGAGQCAVVQLPSGKIILIDAGSQTPDLWRRCIGPFLKSQGLSRIDSIYLSHANYDHFSAAADAARVAEVKHVFVGPHFAVEAKEHLAGNHLLQSLSAPALVLTAGGKIELDSQTMLEVLWPPAEVDLRDNDASLVIKVTSRGQRMLFTGDIQDVAMRGLLGHPEQLACDVLVAPHHGSSEESTARFIDACGAKIVLSSNDNTLTQKQRTFEKIVGERELYRTNRCGAITVTIDKLGTIQSKTFLTRAHQN
ncbi:MAG TPA: ComEC/Rec2 family competence protein, partial [Tepidisphaeraceae bacterium]|nr:ComEC/Rec2 family competence protein [Tepidisphaeraceae bacterium]